MQREIVGDLPLLDSAGVLQTPGYARRPVWRYDPANVRATPWRALDRLRLKEWDFYGITTPDLYFAFAVANIGYAGVVFTQWIDIAAGKERAERVAVTPFGADCALPRTSERGDVSVARRGLRLSIEHRGDKRIVRIDWRRFLWQPALRAELIIDAPLGGDGIAMATPIGARGFYYNHKIPAMPTRGWLELGSERRVLLPGEALATLDWGRGAWPYATFWNWATASGRRADGRLFGLNLGQGFGDLRAATENCFFVDGAITKLDRVDFSYDRRAWRRPWRFASPDGRVDLTLTPRHEIARRANLGVVRSELHQLLGTVAGTVINESGERLAIEGVPGWAEEHRALW